MRPMKSSEVFFLQIFKISCRKIEDIYIQIKDTSVSPAWDEEKISQRKYRCNVDSVMNFWALANEIG